MYIHPPHRLSTLTHHPVAAPRQWTGLTGPANDDPQIQLPQAGALTRQLCVPRIPHHIPYMPFHSIIDYHHCRILRRIFRSARPSKEYMQHNFHHYTLFPFRHFFLYLLHVVLCRLLSCGIPPHLFLYIPTRFLFRNEFRMQDAPPEVGWTCCIIPASHMFQVQARPHLSPTPKIVQSPPRHVIFFIDI